MSELIPFLTVMFVLFCIQVFIIAIVVLKRRERRAAQPGESAKEGQP
jgi:biopolymer transport protein ExbD